MLVDPSPGKVVPSPLVLMWSDVREGPFSIYLGTTPVDLDFIATVSPSTLLVALVLNPGTCFWQVANGRDERSTVHAFLVHEPTNGSVPELPAAALAALAAAARLVAAAARAARP